MNNNIVERISDIEVMAALDSLQDYVTRTRLYYQQHKQDMYNDIMFEDILACYKALTRGLNRTELSKIKIDK